MSQRFRELLRKVGSGQHTSQALSRAEAAEATRLMLVQEATPAQIGAFLIAHRIRRPTGEEMAGMLDAYTELGPKLRSLASSQSVLVLASPYDGRSRTASLSPLVALVLAAAGQSVILHGGDRMPTKFGLSLAETWQALGVDWTVLSLSQVQQVFDITKIGFVYLPTHFPLAYGLVTYRDQIGKRPPLATLELIWSPCPDAAQIVASGFVHPPTEKIIREALTIRGQQHFLTIKGLEGSCDLPRERTAIIGVHRAGRAELERVLLHPRDYGFAGADIIPEEATIAAMQAALMGAASELARSLTWNAGFHLWQTGTCCDLKAGLTWAEELLRTGRVHQILYQLQEAVHQTQVAVGSGVY